MRISKKIFLPLLAVSSLAAVTGAQAAVVNVNSFAVVETFSAFNGLVGQGPVALAGGLSVTSTIDSTIGAFQADLGDNGNWGAGSSFAGIGDLSFESTSTLFNGSMTFNLGAGYSGAGATFSIFQASGGTSSITLEALSSGGSVLESTVFSVNFNDPTLYNAGTFVGFQRATNDIYSLRVSGDGFVLDDVSLAPVPVPAALPLLLSGLAGAFGMMRRRRIAAA
jgi:hypothetical protein